MSVTQTQLASVRAAIARIESTGVAEFAAGSERTRMQELSALYARERELLSRLAVEAGPIAKPIHVAEI